MKEEQILFLWLIMVAVFAFVVWRLMQEKDVKLTLAFTDKKESGVPASHLRAPNHHGFVF